MNEHRSRYVLLHEDFADRFLGLGDVAFTSFFWSLTKYGVHGETFLRGDLLTRLVRSHPKHLVHRLAQDVTQELLAEELWAPGTEAFPHDTEWRVLGEGRWWKRGALSRPTYRRKIPRGLRLAVYERDGWRCRCCGSTDKLSLDHIHPYSLGGADSLHNLQTLCRSCNSKKGARV